ncbi:syntaxin-8 [Chironomus tepperi]|uniref:syntaxin-8 n=1 Tax=Chironomus tepperi TaxID=113505 RepID=UPI00391FAD81
MALVNIDDEFDSWLSDFSALERLTQQISTQITERDSQNTVTEYNKISTRLKIQIRQFENEYKQLERKLQVLGRQGKVTSDELERRTRQLEQIASKKVQIDSRFRNTSASSSRSQLFQTAARNDIPDDDPILDPEVPVEVFRQEQQQIIRHQDDSLESLSKVISRQKNIAIRIGNEVDTQNEIIDNIADQMDTMNSRVGSTTRNVENVADKDSTFGLWIIIIILFVAIIIVGIL